MSSAEDQRSGVEPGIKKRKIEHEGSSVNESQGSQAFYLRNSELQSKSPGVIYRRSMNWWDRHPKDQFVAFDSLICGDVENNPSTGDNWLRVKIRAGENDTELHGYLPVVKWGSRLLFPACSGQESVISKDGAAMGGATHQFLENSQQNKEHGVLGPMMPPKDTDIFSKLLEGASSFLEFGCGGSTVHALSYPNVLQIYSVESDRQWLDALRGRQDISEAIEHGRLKLTHVDIGPVVRTGWPLDESAREHWPAYSGAVAGVNQAFDLVLVDGRFRTACFLKSLERSIQGDGVALGTFAMHNFYSSGEREVRYPAITEFVDIVAEFDYGETIGVFRPKDKIDPVALAAAIKNFEYEPR